MLICSALFLYRKVQVEQLHEALALAEEEAQRLAAALEGEARAREELVLLLTWHEAAAGILEESGERSFSQSEDAAEEMAALRQREAEAGARLAELMAALSATQHQAAVASEELSAALTRQRDLEQESERLRSEAESSRLSAASSASDLATAIGRLDGMQALVCQLEAEATAEHQRRLKAEAQVAELSVAAVAVRVEAERNADLGRAALEDLSQQLAAERAVLTWEREEANELRLNLKEAIGRAELSEGASFLHLCDGDKPLTL